MTDGFTARRIEADGTPILCHEGGSGDTVITLHGGSGAAPTALEKMLAQKFRVVALDSPVFAAGSPQDGALLVVRILAALSPGKYSLIADGTAASAALRHTVDAAAPPEALVLLSPVGTPAIAETRLGEIKAPTLVLTGTKENPAADAFARLCAEHIPESYPMLVYDSGPEMASERAAALFEVVADFLERGGRFVLERQESVISP